MLKILVSVAILVCLARNIDLENTLSFLAGVNRIFLPFIALMLFMQSAISALKWKILISREEGAPYLFLLKNYYIGNFLSLFLPSSIGGDAYRVFSLKKLSSDMAANTSSVVFDRLSGLLALTTITAFSASIYLGELWIFPLFSLSTMVIFLLCRNIFVNSHDRRFKKLFFLGEVVRNLFVYVGDGPLLAKVLLISFLFHSNMVLIINIYCLALGVEMEIGYLYMVVPLILFAEALPISINGFGVREGTLLFFFLQAGKTSEEALAVSLLLITMRYFMSLSIGGTLFMATFWQSRFGAER